MIQNRPFFKLEQTALKIVSLMKALWPNYQQIAIIPPITEITLPKCDLLELSKMPARRSLPHT